MPVDTRFHCPNLHIVDTHNMLVVAIARQPGDDSWCAGYVACLYVAWTQRHILANDHSTCCITGCSSVGCDGTHTDPMWLQRICKIKTTNFSYTSFLEYCAMLNANQLLMLWIIITAFTFRVKQSLWSFRTSATIYQSTWHNIPNDLNLQHHLCKNLKSH